MMYFTSVLDPMKLAIVGTAYLCVACGAIASADEPLIVFRSVDDVRQEFLRWDAEDSDQYDQDRVIEVKMDTGKPSLGVALGDDPLGPEVKRVVEGSAADLAGIKKGDHLRSINKVKLDSINDGSRLVDQHPFGAVMDLEFNRNNYTYTRRIRFLPPSGIVEGESDSSRYLRDRIDELEQRLIATQRRNQKLESAVRFLLDDRPVIE